jgi:hypothetical protein
LTTSRPSQNNGNTDISQIYDEFSLLVFLKWNDIRKCRWLTAGQWFSPVTPLSSTKRTDRHGITEILLKVVLNTINQTKHICYLVETFKAAVSSIKCWFMEPVNSFWPSSIVMCNLWHNIQLVEGSQVFSRSRTTSAIILPEKTTDLSPVTDKFKLYHINVVSNTPRRSRVRTHNISGHRQVAQVVENPSPTTIR